FGGEAERHTASEVRAPLVQRHQTLRDDALGDVVDAGRGVHAVAAVRNDVEAARPEVERLVRLVGLVLDVVELAGRAHRSEPALQVRPQERDRGRSELGSEDGERGEERATEELPAGDRLGPLALLGSATAGTV